MAGAGTQALVCGGEPRGAAAGPLGSLHICCSSHSPLRRSSWAGTTGRRPLGPCLPSEEAPSEWQEGSSSDLQPPWNQGATVTTSTSRTSKEQNCHLLQRSRHRHSAARTQNRMGSVTLISQVQDDALMRD